MPVATETNSNERVVAWQRWKLGGKKKRERGFLKERSFLERSCPEKFSHNHKHTPTDRRQWTSSHSVPTRVMQQAAEVCEVASWLPRCSCPPFSPFQSAVCAVVPAWARSRFRDSTLPIELWGTKVCCNVFTIPVGSLVLLSLNDRFP